MIWGILTPINTHETPPFSSKRIKRDIKILGGTELSRMIENINGEKIKLTLFPEKLSKFILKQQGTYIGILFYFFLYRYFKNMFGNVKRNG